MLLAFQITGTQSHINLRPYLHVELYCTAAAGKVRLSLQFFIFAISPPSSVLLCGQTSRWNVFLLSER